MHTWMALIHRFRCKQESSSFRHFEVLGILLCLAMLQLWTSDAKRWSLMNNRTYGWSKIKVITSWCMQHLIHFRMYILTAKPYDTFHVDYVQSTGATYFYILILVLQYSTYMYDGSWITSQVRTRAASPHAPLRCVAQHSGLPGAMCDHRST